MTKYYLFTLFIGAVDRKYYRTYCSKVAGSLTMWLDETIKRLDADVFIVNSIEITKEEWEEFSNYVN